MPVENRLGGIYMCMYMYNYRTVTLLKVHVLVICTYVLLRYIHVST